MTRHLPQRKSPRLQGYDYSQQGAYFVTIVTVQRLHLFGTVTDGEMHLSDLGEIVHNEIARIPDYWDGRVDVDAFVVMPNHVHVIVIIGDTVSVIHKPPPTLGTIIGSMKSGVARTARRRGIIDDAASPWQSRYHDHIIRSEPDLNRIHHYTLTNPACWADDALNA